MKILAGATFEKIQQAQPQTVFSELTLGFLDALSKNLLSHPQAKDFPEITALGFWLRKANVQKMLNQVPAQENIILRPLGLVVHFAPANVDLQFVYSWVCSLLMGNKNLIRVSSTESVSRDWVIAEVNKLFASTHFKQLTELNSIITYPRDSNITAQISAMADGRMMWGGDQTILDIRRHPTKPRCRDIAFADRFSACLINGDAVQTDADIEQVAELLWRDTKPFSQQACSSPKIVLWLGSDKPQMALHKALCGLAQKDKPAITQATNHLVFSQLIAAKVVRENETLTGAVCWVQVNEINEGIVQLHPGQGLYLLASIEKLEQVTEMLSEKCQTLSYWGFDKNSYLSLQAILPITGVDRLVPLGQALDFGPIWDGFDLFSCLSKKVVSL